MRESSLAFGDRNGLVGTICHPPRGERAAAVGLVLFNAGMVHRVGPHRLNVRLARALAARGIPSIRFDLAGQGDSARSGASRAFDEQAVADLRTAMDALGAEAGVHRFALFGFCSGGVHSYTAAQAEPRIAGLILYDTYVYPTPRSRWNRFVRPLRERGIAANLAQAREKLARRWRVSRGLEPPGTEAVAMFKTPSRGEFVRVFRALHERGVKLGVMASGAPWSAYPDQFRDAFADTGLTGFVTFDFLAETEHNATLLHQQSDLIGRIERWMVDLDGRLRQPGA